MILLSFMLKDMVVVQGVGLSVRWCPTACRAAACICQGAEAPIEMFYIDGSTFKHSFALKWAALYRLPLQIARRREITSVHCGIYENPAVEADRS